MTALEARVKELAPAEKLLEFRAAKGEAEAQLELGEKLIFSEPPRAKALLKKCQLPRAVQLLTESFLGSMAAPYWSKLKEWLPDMNSIKLLAKFDGHSQASIDAFLAAAVGRARTLTFIETENGGSICGAYLDPAWVVKGWTNDPGRKSFLFTLKNHLGVVPTKFPKKATEWAAHTDSSYFCFGACDGIIFWNDARTTDNYQLRAALRRRR